MDRGSVFSGHHFRRSFLSNWKHVCVRRLPGVVSANNQLALCADDSKVYKLKQLMIKKAFNINES